jgi:hypothetical protein
VNELKDLPIKAHLDKVKKVFYYEIETANKSRATFIVAPITKAGVEIRPSVNQKNGPTSQTARSEGAIASVNGGYFNLKDGLSASYVTIDGQKVCDPHENSALMMNPKLQPFMSQILNRSELRFLTDGKGHNAVTIQPHNEKVSPGFSIKHAIQAGPRLLPKITAEEEAFIRKDGDGDRTDSIGCLKTAARTAVGITADGKAIVLCVSGPKQDEFSSGVTLPQLADLMAKLGCVAALNFDGGTSTTMAIRSDLLAESASDVLATAPPAGTESQNQSAPGYTLVCGRHPETLVKSCLIIR